MLGGETLMPDTCAGFHARQRLDVPRDDIGELRGLATELSGGPGGQAEGIAVGIEEVLEHHGFAVVVDSA
ncbi:hypothetical protein AVL61_12095 [Kocuria rosea subsp. polaris]|uniref:Uncharacterized protein n=1 Tax=Kocuria rosea subsp. polaris TaxID=136273 RepID=A0A0W8I4J0_KOCRO|nr:hypothetical protein AVL61_12095 [Kocuria polaris]